MEKTENTAQKNSLKLSDVKTEILSDKNNKFILELKYNPDNTITINACYITKLLIHIFEKKFTLESIGQVSYFKDYKSLEEIYIKLKEIIETKKFNLSEKDGEIQISFSDAYTISLVKKEEIQNGEIKEEDKIMINYKDGLNKKEYSKISLICDKNIMIDELYQLIISKREISNYGNGAIVFCGERIYLNLNLSLYNASLLKNEIFYIDSKMKIISVLYENKNYTFYIANKNDILTELLHYVSIWLKKPEKYILLLKDGKEKYDGGCMCCFMGDCNFISVKIISDEDFNIYIGKIFLPDITILYKHDLTINKTLSNEDILNSLLKELKNDYNKDDYEIRFYPKLHRYPISLDDIFPGDELDIKIYPKPEKIEDFIKSDENFKIEIKSITQKNIMLNVCKKLRIYELKILAEKYFQIPIESQKLLIPGIKQLTEDFETIEENNINEGSILYLVLRF